MIPHARKILPSLRNQDRLWLFLDYDGTLADFAPTPDVVTPDRALIELLSALADEPDHRLAIISGRRLAHVRKLVPIPGIWLAGTYGAELWSPDGNLIHPLDYSLVRPTLDRLKPAWETLISSQPGFYLEDKGWSLAIHARFASDKNADEILSQAYQLADSAIASTQLHLIGGHKFLEVGPQAFDKGWALGTILSKGVFPGALPVFIGDDDKDEKAFGTVKANHGVAILVAAHPHPTQADYYLESPAAVRAWLNELRQPHQLSPN